MNPRISSIRVLKTNGPCYPQPTSSTLPFVGAPNKVTAPILTFFLRKGLATEGGTTRELFFSSNGVISPISATQQRVLYNGRIMPSFSSTFSISHPPPGPPPITFLPCEHHRAASLPHELVQDVLHPHVHPQGAEPVVPEQLEDVDDVPAALLEDKLLSVIDAHEVAGDWESREAWRKG